jgi:hypothetical protein
MDGPVGGLVETKWDTEVPAGERPMDNPGRQEPPGSSEAILPCVLSVCG